MLYGVGTDEAISHVPVPEDVDTIAIGTPTKDLDVRHRAESARRTAAGTLASVSDNMMVREVHERHTRDVGLVRAIQGQPLRRIVVAGTLNAILPSGGPIRPTTMRSIERISD